MDNPESRLHLLFDRYYQGTATAQEKEELMALVRTGEFDALLEEYLQEKWAQSAEGEELFAEVKSNSILNSILEHPQQEDRGEAKIFKLNWMQYAAAAVIILTGFGVWYSFENSQENERVQPQIVESSSIRPGGNKALLTLADGSAIALDQVQQGVLARQGDVEISKQQDGIVVYSAKSASKSTATGINTLTTPKGGQYEILLPDGSKVWLNASSSIRFPSLFAATERRVEITGEAYFEVAKDRSKPFRVRFNDSEVLVLGTSFNIMAYPDEETSKTTLVEGSVSISNVHQQAKLVPGQQAAVLSTGQIRTRYIPVDEAVAWRKGMFHFKNAGVEEVARQLARWYDVDIEYQGQVPVKQFTGSVSRQVELSELVGMLRYAGVNCRIQDKKIIISP
ncbi:FecR family protein [Telluribacter sp. SYSU D00476]|uniref:FecR family protein n=1 Tax=Telluribacter sp. SYSU D00476 TaxID=2811430 RepID=UPI001FF2DE98|nr:FecR family protein [Telluribacter sp. SYSU D00476]